MASRSWHDLEPMAQIESDAHVRAVHLLGDPHRVVHRLDPEARMRIQGDPHVCLAASSASSRRISTARASPSRAEGFSALALGEQPQDRVSPFEDFHRLRQGRIVGLPARIEVDAGVEGEQLEIVLIELLQHLRERTRSRIARANPGIAEFLEHLHLLSPLSCAWRPWWRCPSRRRDSVRPGTPRCCSSRRGRGRPGASAARRASHRCRHWPASVRSARHRCGRERHYARPSRSEHWRSCGRSCRNAGPERPRPASATCPAAARR